MFSETRFAEYVHRTYDHFLKMFPLIFEKLKRDEENTDTHAKVQSLSNIEKDLVQVGTVMDLLFMHEISNL